MRKKSLTLLRKLGIVLAIMFGIFYGGASFYLYINQDHYIFYPKPLTKETRAQLERKPGITPLLIKADDGVILHGWIHRTAGTTKQPVIIYFGGNAEEISYRVQEFGQLSDWTIISLNYRGYGDSQGKPSQKNLFRDALTLYDNVASRSDIDSQHIVIIGYSLGTGVATYLASKRSIAGAILIAPFDSILNITKKDYSFFPVQLLLKHPFESIQYAPVVTCPLLCVIAVNDEVIPAEYSRRLVAAWKGPKQTIEVQGYNHGSILSWPGLMDVLNRFLATIKNCADQVSTK